MRLANVERSFGNKTTWDTPFEQHFKRFVSEINEAVFDSGVVCQAINYDALEITDDYDLVYVDAPYISEKGQMDDYLWMYHFLEGLVDYTSWPQRIDFSQKHRPFQKERPSWKDEEQILQFFREILDHFRKSTLVLSYRNDGLPTERELVKLMKQFKKKVRVVHYGEYQYALSSNGHSKEIMIIGE
jgi:adenine-specific DNA methylase